MEVQYQKLNQFDTEIIHYQNRLTTDPNDLEAYRQLAKAYVLNGQVQESILTVQAAINLQPDFASIYLTIGNALQATHQIELAIWAYSQALEVQSNFAEAHANLGSMYYQKSRWEEAISSYKAALKLQPKQASIHWMLGNTLTQLDRVDEAEFCYNRAIQLQPDQALFYLKLGQNLQDRGRTEEAINCYQTVLTLEPDHQIAHAKLTELSQSQNQASFIQNPPELNLPISSLTELNFSSDCAERSEQFEEGGIELSGQIDRQDSSWNDTTTEHLLIEELEEFLVDQPQGLVSFDSDAGVQSYQQQVEESFRQKNFEQVVHLCSQILKLQPHQFLAYINLGNAYTCQGKTKEAIHAYQQALKLQANLPEVYTNLGTLYTRQAQTQLAIDCYQKAIELCPNLAAAHWNLGKVFQQLKQEEAAIACWQKALEFQPDLVEPRFNFEFGNALARRGKWEEAIQSYQRAIALKPDWVEAYANIGCVRSQQGRHTEAIPYFEKAIEIKSDLSELYLHFGYTLVKLGRYQDAIVQYQRLIKLQPNSSETYNNIANIYSTIGQVEKAIKSFEYALQFRPDWPEVHCRLAHIQKQDHPHKAVIHLEKAVELKPDYLEAHQQLCDLLSHSTRLAKAREATDRYCQSCGNLAPVLSRIAYVFAYTQSGSCEAALEKLLELEAICYSQLKNLSVTEINILYEILLFTLSHLRDDLEKNAQFYRLIAETYYKKRRIKPLEIQVEIRVNRQEKLSTQPLRIGFLSKHFRRHSVGWCSQALIRELSQITPHVHLYVTGRLNSDQLTQSFEQTVSKFYWPKAYPNGFASPEEIAQEVVQDQIDILLDLDSITVPVNAQVLHYSPAPICATWLGFDAPYLSNQHYFLCDEHSHPFGMDDFYLEQLIRLPETSVAIDGFPAITVERNRARQQLGIGIDQMVYLCVAPGRKTNFDMVAAQVKILKFMPDAILLRKGQGDHAVIQEMYTQACKTLDVDINRVLFIGLTKTEEEHRAIYGVADVLLDSYPYNGGTHNLEALWANLPVLTRSGGQYLSRMGYAFLKAAHLDFGVAWSWDEYIELGVQLGQNRELREQIREHLIQSKQPQQLAPLWNPRKLAQDMYNTFKVLLKKHV
ncbi:MAG: tetratricopeptide repeat protein [Microcoleaceae cyanobacterium]